MSGVSSNYCSNPDTQGKILSYAIGSDISQVPQLSAVCKMWQKVIKEESTIWKQIFDHHVKNITHRMNGSLLGTYREIVKSFVETRDKCFQKNLALFNDETYAKNVLTIKSDLTSIFKLLIDTNDYECLALFFLFKPSFNTSEIASELILRHARSSRPAGFCFALLIKLHYDLTEVYKNHRDTLFSMDLMLKNSKVCCSDLVESGFSRDWLEEYFQANPDALISNLHI